MTQNPYQPPLGDLRIVKPPEPILRRSLATTIQAFLAGETTAFQFDKQLDAFRESEDPVVRYVVDAAWCHYDDYVDHQVCLSKPEWDYFQRLLLLLASDCQIENETTCRWSLKQLLAAASLVTFAILALRTGWSYDLLVLAIPFGLISIALSVGPLARTVNKVPYQAILFPFATFSDLAAAYRSSAFQKTRYPQCMAARRIRSPFQSTLLCLPTFAAWLMLAPIPLLFQLFPAKENHIRVVAA